MDRQRPFHTSGVCHLSQLQNFGYLKYKNFLAKCVDDEKVTVWCEFSAYTVTRKFFFEEMPDSGFEIISLTFVRYTDVLHNQITPIQADKNLLESTTFMQDKDGSASHIAMQVKDLLCSR